MNLPKEISPNPLLTSTVEIRFNSSLKDDSVLSSFYPVFSPSFPIINDTGIIKSMKDQLPQLEYNPSFIFKNDNYSISVGKNVISFENVGTYHFWSNYFPVIKTNLEILKSLNIVKSILRIGVRYSSLFEGQTNPSRVIKNPIGLGFEGYEEQLQIYQTNFKKNNINLFLQIAPQANSFGPTIVKNGFLIDIDASSIGKGDLKISDQLFGIIDNLHMEGKTLFFSLLNEGFLKSLNPKY